jgi:hypothetical protein
VSEAQRRETRHISHEMEEDATNPSHAHYSHENNIIISHTHSSYSAQERGGTQVDRRAGLDGTHSLFRIIRAHFSPIIMAGAAVFPETMNGMTLQSATRRFLIPKTLSLESTTAVGSSARPILQVPTGWKIVVPIAIRIRQERGKG